MGWQRTRPMITVHGMYEGEKLEVGEGDRAEGSSSAITHSHNGYHA